MNILTTALATEVKVIFDVAKDLLTDVPLRWTPAGLLIVALDNTETSLLHIELKGQNYHYERESSFYIPAAEIHRSLRSISNNLGTFRLSFEDDGGDHLSLSIENISKGVFMVHRLRKGRKTTENITIPATTFRSVVSMSSTDLQRLLKELPGTKINVSSKEDVLTFSGDSATCASEITIKEGLTFSSVCSENISGSFLSKTLLKFARPIGPNVTLYLDKDLPLVLRYTLETATVKLLISPDS